MAKVKKNVVMKGLSGSLGDQLVVKGGKGGQTIVSIKPTFPEDREFSDAQKEHMEDFREAMMYAKDAAKTEVVYAEKAEDTPLSAYNVAIADWFHEPEIGDIDLSGWTGQAGEPIRVKVVDDVKVDQVTVLITDAEGALIEQGAATQEDGLRWLYTTTKPAAGQPKVIAVARDLPGNIAQMVVETTPVQYTA